MGKKICSKCKIEKDVCEFNKCSKSKLGVQSSCKKCRKKNREETFEQNKIRYQKWKSNNIIYTKNYNQNYYKNNTEKINKTNKNYYENNKEKVLEINKKYYENNIEKIREIAKIYRNKNKEKISLYFKKYRLDNPLKLKERKVNFEKNNPNYAKEYFKKRRELDSFYKLKVTIRNRIRTFLKTKNIKKNNKTFDIVGCTPEFLKEHIEKQFTEGMSWGLMGQHIHIDHIIPLSSAKTEEEVYKLCHYTNLQPLWAKDNLKKSNKMLV